MWEGSLLKIILGPKHGVGKLISYFKNIANAFLMASCVLKGKKPVISWFVLKDFKIRVIPITKSTL